MRVTVTAIDTHPTDGHPDSYHDYMMVGKGSHLVVGSAFVIVDGEIVLTRDRRAKRNRTPGHPWISANREWTTFTVTVEP